MLDLQYILDYQYKFDDCDANSIREYFKELLITLWREQDGFSGKRPFGNSCWDYDVFHPLILCGAIDGKLDEDGYVVYKSFNEKAANELIERLIEECFKGNK